MLQRPGCFVFYVLVAFIGLAMFIGWVNETRASATEPAGFADGQQNAEAAVAPTASATMIMTATPNPLVLTEASSNATHGAALTALANDQATHDTGTRIASTQTPAYWTADANAIAKQQAEAARNKALLEVQLLAGTVTAAPTSEWKTEVAVWPTIEAQMTEAKDAQIMADNARWWGHVAADAWSLVLVAIPVSIILALIVSSVVMPNAFSWRLQGVSGGQAQASVVAAAKTQPPIPTTTAGEPAPPLSRYTPIEHLALRALGRMARPDKGGPDATMLTSAPTFDDNRTRDKVRDALIASGLAISVNGVGVELVEPWTIGTLAQAIAEGEITLIDPPTPASVGQNNLTGKVR